jgi:hypothetical protein
MLFLISLEDNFKNQYIMKTRKLFFMTMLVILGGIAKVKAQQPNWNTGGNYGTAPSLSGTYNVVGTSFIGTSDDVDLVFRRSNIFSGFLGTTNTFFGHSQYSNFNLLTGEYNSIFGVNAGRTLTTQSYNVAFGAEAIARMNGARNTAIGYHAGYNNLGGSTVNGTTYTGGVGNIYIGADSGPLPNTWESDQLYIDNSTTGTPLIKGDLFTDDLIFNVNNVSGTSRVTINSGADDTSGLKFTNLVNGSTPSTSVTNAKVLTVDGSGDVVLVSNAPAAIVPNTTNGGYWGLTGNYGTTPSLAGSYGVAGTSFIGTIDDVNLVFRRNNVLSGLIGTTNTIFGHSLYSNFGSMTGEHNSFFGENAGRNLTTQGFNVAIGAEAIARINGSSNTAIGYHAGYNNLGGSTVNGSTYSGGEGNVYMGANSGPEMNNWESNQLYIDNSTTNTPLIKGDFAAENLMFNVDFDIDSRVTINSGLPYVANTVGLSGLRFANLRNGNTASTSNNKVLSVNVDGDVVLVNDAGATDAWHTTGNDNISPIFFGGYTTTGNSTVVAQLAAINSSGFIGTRSTSVADVVFRRGSAFSGMISYTNTSFGMGSTGVTPTGASMVGQYNTSYGSGAGAKVTDGSSNVAIGYQAYSKGNGLNNTMIGALAGNDNTTGAANVFIGYRAGETNTGSNTLIIDNSPTQTPLILGNFIDENITFNVDESPTSKVTINGGVYDATTAGKSGLMFTTLKSANIVGTVNTKTLTVDANGNVVLQNMPAANVSSVSNAITGGTLTTTVNGVSSTPVVLPSFTDISIYANDGTLAGNRTVTMGNNNLIFNSTTTQTQNGGRIYIGNQTAFTPTNFATTNGNYKLFVEGGVLTEQAKVALSGTGNWSDYVFANDYKLMPLKEIESFVKENKHLPGIESAEELVKNGLDLGDMQAKQMGKIEELTLYAIEQEKRLEKQGKEIEELKAQIKVLIDRK